MPPSPAARSRSKKKSPENSILYRHSKRPDWGLALLAWEDPDKRAYQFDDGRLRVLKKGFYEMMEVVEQSGDGLDERIASDLEANVAARDEPPLKKSYSFDDQVKIFKKLFPEGFQGAEWENARRGEGVEAPLKRHREPVLAAAREQLSREVVEKLIEEDRPAEVLQRGAVVLEGTDLVRSTRVEELVSLGEAHQSAVGKTLAALLYGEGRYGVRFGAWLEALREALGIDPSWGIATAPSALVHPAIHVCVRPSTFRKQAAVFAPGKIYSKGPRRGSYKNFLRVAERTRQRLESEGLAPRDLIDIHDFIFVTLRPSAADVLRPR